jgi:hypothetical protein
MKEDPLCSRIGGDVMSEAGMDARTVVGIMGRLTATESIGQFLAGGTGIVGYVLINIRDTGYKQKKLYM